MIEHRYEGSHVLAPLVEAWLGKIARAREAKQPWQDIADECMQFYAGSCGFLWDERYRRKFWDTNDGAVQPKFRVTVNKAFELVALFGPSLYWQNPVRRAIPRQPLELRPEMFPQLEADPLAAMEFQRLQQEIASDYGERRLRAELMERYLNWTPAELRLHEQAQRAIADALVKGRGLLMAAPYRPPGSDRLMIGSWHIAPERLLIDPDAESLDDAWWIAIEFTEPVWRVERDRGYPPGFLKPSAQFESANTQGEVLGNESAAEEHRKGRTQDMMSYWKIWTRCGPGTRLSNIKLDVKDRLEEATTDYCYLEVAKGTPFPLNTPPKFLETATKEEVGMAFRWPTPHYRDRRWPINALDFYPVTGRAWPLAPLAPALGELKVINVFLAHLCNRVWMSCRDFIVCLESARESVEKTIKEGHDLSWIYLENIHESIDKVIGFLQHPPTNLDAFRVLEWFFELFERRTGLSELMYGVQRRQSRSATDSRIKQSQVSIRPDYMADKVEAWQTEQCKSEALEIKWRIGGRHVVDLLGPAGARLWDRLIAAADVERIIHDIDYRLEASSARRPNRERDLATMEVFMPVAMPAAQAHAAMTGNFKNVWWLLEQWAKKAELDVSGMDFSVPPPPPPPPQAGPGPKEAAALEAAQAKLGMEAQRHEQQMTQAQEQHAQRMQQQAEDHALRMAMRQLEARSRGMFGGPNGE